MASKRQSAAINHDEQEEKEVKERSAPAGKIVYKAILSEGREELERSSSALFFSGIAAGLSMGFSFISQGLLYAHLPDTHWRPLITNLGYSMGFLIVVLGRQQLFTENTLTPILPLLVDRRKKMLMNVGRLWLIVLVANLLGAFLMAWAIDCPGLFSPETHQAFIHLGHQSMVDSFGLVLIKGIFAGWLIALMVWLLPFAETARVWVIIFLTYLIGLGQFSHVIAGSVDVFFLAAVGEKSWAAVFLHFVFPTLIGNILGGVTLVAALNHAQVVAGEQGADL